MAKPPETTLPTERDRKPTPVANEGEGARSAARQQLDTDAKAMAKALDRAEGEGMREAAPVTQGTSGKQA